MYGSNIPTMLVITVSSGTGTVNTQLNGKVMAVGIVAPSTIATYHFPYAYMWPHREALEI